MKRKQASAHQPKKKSRQEKNATAKLNWAILPSDTVHIILSYYTLPFFRKFYEVTRSPDISIATRLFFGYFSHDKSRQIFPLYRNISLCNRGFPYISHTGAPFHMNASKWKLLKYIPTNARYLDLNNVGLIENQTDTRLLERFTHVEDILLPRTNYIKIEALKQVLLKMPNLRSFIVHDFHIDDAKVDDLSIIEAFKGCTKVETLVWKNLRLSQTGLDLILKTLPNLVHLDFGKFIDVQMNIKSDKLESLCIQHTDRTPRFECEKLRILRMEHLKVGSDDMMNILTGMPKLEELWIHLNKTDDYTAVSDLICASTCLKRLKIMVASTVPSFNLSNSSSIVELSGDVSKKHLLRWLEKDSALSKSLRSIDLSGRLQSDLAQHIARNVSGLTTINMSRCNGLQIHDLDAISKMPNLTEVDLSGMNITCNGVAKFLQNANIKKLNLMGNDLRNQGAELIAIKGIHLTDLNYGENRIDNDGIIALMNLANLKSLNIYSSWANKLGDRTVNIINKNTTLEELFLPMTHKAADVVKSCPVQQLFI